MDAETGDEPESLMDSLMRGEIRTTSLGVDVMSPASHSSPEEFPCPTEAQVEAARAVMEKRVPLEGRNMIVGDDE